MRSFLTILLILVLLSITGCTVETTPELLTKTPAATLEPTEAPTDTPTPRPTAAPICTSWGASGVDPDSFGWWNQTVFYEIFVRSFYDSDGDGIGDFNGIIEKLDYLNDGDPATSDDLGITGIWLMPIQPSPSYHGYDVTDYLAVNPEYGSLEDFQHLLDEAHARGIKVIIDLVLNHTSTQHPWFVESSASTENPYRDYYIWADPPPSFQSPWGTDVWHSMDTGSYYGIFWGGMPDLNYSNPKVTSEAQEIIRFWLEDVGVDGFRLDAIKHLIENGEVQENTEATHAWWEGFYDYYTGINPEAFTVGEAWTSTSEVVRYISDEMNIAFEFDTAGAIITSARTETKRAVQSVHELVLESYPPHQYATFLTNHDQSRVMSELSKRDGRAKSAASLLLTGPGVPFLYYGEEIGQSGYKPDENIRTPMQWTGDVNAGFTTSDIPWLWPQDNFENYNVALQQDDPDSLFNHYRELIQTRNRFPALKTGNLLELPTNERGLYAFMRTYGDQTLLIMINLSKSEIKDYTLCLQDGPLVLGEAQDIFHSKLINTPLVNPSGGFDNYKPIDVLDAYTTYIIELK